MLCKTVRSWRHLLRCLFCMTTINTNDRAYQLCHGCVRPIPHCFRERSHQNLKSREIKISYSISQIKLIEFLIETTDTALSSQPVILLQDIFWFYQVDFPTFFTLSFYLTMYKYLKKIFVICVITELDLLNRGGQSYFQN